MSRATKIPAAVRAVILANVLFLGFCVFEFGDGLLRQGGRVFYWTTFLFFPALALLCGHLWAKRA